MFLVLVTLAVQDPCCPIGHLLNTQEDFRLHSIYLRTAMSELALTSLALDCVPGKDSGKCSLFQKVCKKVS
ncbi:hypothetical protein AMEX_G11409 [Astyanax mexicanus]|uniref:Uncharacterized protein n=1 Tax=Astyanax mexicanus TaxID=7994 RepID=A0A8T2LYQ2_ASTMX|nr:hypothetical protein AMEX_G11409 [Astyanax mexicanus]